MASKTVKVELITEPFEKALRTLQEAWAEFQKDTSNTFVRDSAQGTAVKYSDMDIALDSNGKLLPDNVIVKLASLFEKSLLPYSVDVIDLNTVSSAFRAKIAKDFVKITQI